MWRALVAVECLGRCAPSPGARGSCLVRGGVRAGLLELEGDELVAVRGPVKDIDRLLKQVPKLQVHWRVLLLLHRVVVGQHPDRLKLALAQFEAVELEVCGSVCIARGGGHHGGTTLHCPLDQHLRRLAIAVEAPSGDEVRVLEQASRAWD